MNIFSFDRPLRTPLLHDHLSQLHQQSLQAHPSNARPSKHTVATSTPRHTPAAQHLHHNTSPPPPPLHHPINLPEYRTKLDGSSINTENMADVQMSDATSSKPAGKPRFEVKKVATLQLSAPVRSLLELRLL